MNPKRASHDLSIFSILATLLVVLISAADSTATCYRTNGVAGTDDIQPCNNNLAAGAQSACCNLGKTPPDLCLAGGLCYRQDGSDGNFLIFAVGCTDETGTDAACQQYCNSDAEIEMYSLNACNDGRWCCNNITTSESCCDPVTGAGAFALDHVLSLDPAPSDTTQTVTVTTSATSSASSTSNNSNGLYSNTTTCSSNTKIIAGASVGAAIGGFLVASAIALCFMAKWKKSPRRLTAPIQTANSPTALFVPGTESRYEMDAKRREISNVVAHEIDSDGRAELR